MKKICIVTTRHISYNPRVLKEADTLYANGYDVSVVTVNNHALQRSFDEELMKSRHWKLKTIDFRKEVADEKRRWVYLSIKQRLFTVLSRVTYKLGIVERAREKAFDGLMHLAKAEKADLYLVHHAEALAIGFQVSRVNKAKFGFDAEDFHSGMDESSTTSSSAISFLERKYLPYCHYITAASKGIGEAYAVKYNIKSPITILNVFPGVQLTVKAVNNPVKFYWYSQVIGPNRGLELLIEAAGKIKLPFELHLRGSFHDDNYRIRLETLGRELGIERELFFHEPILAEEIISNGNHYDVGLALESDVSMNRNICVTNKVFSYLMSGLAIIGTDTYGQRDIFGYFPDAVQLCRSNDSEDLTVAMKFYIENREKLLEAKKASRIAAENRFNWEKESEKLLSGIKDIFNLN